MGEIADIINDVFPSLTEEGLIKEIETNGKLIEIPAGTIIMDIGSNIRIMPLVTKGAIKVLREDNEGDELFIYYLYPGQSCAMTTQCCVVESPSQIRAIAEYDTVLIAIPIELINDWIIKYNSWKDFILTTYSDRFAELLNTIDSIVFQKLDNRLLEYLEKRAEAGGNNVILATHQDIAYDLHSSREVISRLLKQLEKMKKIVLGRNKIELL